MDMVRVNIMITLVFIVQEDDKFVYLSRFSVYEMEIWRGLISG